jgi:hypothetical protein
LQCIETQCHEVLVNVTHTYPMIIYNFVNSQQVFQLNYPLHWIVKFWRLCLYPLLELNVIVFYQMLIWLEKLSTSILFC